MVSGTHNLLWQYLGSFTLYTLLAIGAIYALFLYFRKNPAGLNNLVNMQLGGISLQSQQQQRKKLEVETVLSLEPRKNLYIVRADRERFLLATSMEGTQFLAKLSEKATIEDALEAAAGHYQKDSRPPHRNDSSGQATAFAGFSNNFVSLFSKPYRA